MAGYAKLHSGILDSSIWSTDVYTRVVWVAMLAKADAIGRVIVAPSRMVEITNVPQDKFDRAIVKLTSPDPESKTPDNEGRRLIPIQGGWQILNYIKYREVRGEDERREYMREYMRNYRKNKDVNSVNTCKQQLAQAEAEAEAEAYKEEEVKEEETSSSTSPKESKSHHTTNAERVISAWQKLPLSEDLKAVSLPGVLAVERELSVLALSPEGSVGVEAVLEGMENYKRALSLPDSQSGKHKLLTWLQKHIRKTYLAEVFNIENHKRSNFQRSGKTDTKAEYERLKAKGEL